MVITYNSDTSSINFYLNGEMVFNYQSSQLQNIFPSGYYSYIFGAQQANTPFNAVNLSSSFTGEMDNMMLFNIELSPAAISNLYQMLPICAGKV